MTEPAKVPAEQPKAHAQSLGAIPRVQTSTPNNEIHLPPIPTFEFTRQEPRREYEGTDFPPNSRDGDGNNGARAQSLRGSPLSSANFRRRDEQFFPRLNLRNTYYSEEGLNQLREANERRSCALEERLRELTHQVNSLQLFEMETRKFNTEQLARLEDIAEDIEQANYNFDNLNARHNHLNQLVNELQEHVVTQSQQLDDTVAILGTMETTLAGERAFLMGEIDHRFEAIPDALQVSNMASHFRLEMPTFRGEPNERPVRFLHALRQYCEGINIPPSQLKLVLDQCLKSLARDWFIFNQDLINSSADLERLFLEQYWSNSIQCSIKRIFVRTYYEARDNLSRAEYVIR